MEFQQWDSMSWREIRRAANDPSRLNPPEQEYAYQAMSRLLEQPANCVSILRSLPDLFFSTPQSEGASRQVIDEMTQQIVYTVEIGGLLQEKSATPKDRLDDASLDFVLSTYDALVGTVSNLIGIHLHEADVSLPEPRVPVSLGWSKRAAKLAGVSEN